MSLNKSKPVPVSKPKNPVEVVTQTIEDKAIPDYVGLVRFLLEPLLESAESLRVDCEKSASKPKVWIRMSFEDPEKGRVFGRGGRNIQAIRTVLAAAAETVGESIYLDIYGSGSGDRDRDHSSDRSFEHSSDERSERRKSPPSTPRAKLPKPAPRDK
ncbi:KH domain-containing protein [Planktothricoides sp. FACHB-1370]|uniref:KH domain-containing protein n=1 Tax=Planktothricoides raciborskii FACHB-1370 TaxID=2949576 RepID=A0ABR8ECF9_9CYAN|nr:KH domain-containing protein [Planktothricoides raciborskii FACHB-1370]MBD2582486.1 KH domain-containing protein [Planktothricoides raciborskii FACHB-1261]